MTNLVLNTNILVEPCGCVMLSIKISVCNFVQKEEMLCGGSHDGARIRARIIIYYLGRAILGRAIWGIVVRLIGHIAFVTGAPFRA